MPCHLRIYRVKTPADLCEMSFFVLRDLDLSIGSRSSGLFLDPRARRHRFHYENRLFNDNCFFPLGPFWAATRRGSFLLVFSTSGLRENLFP